MSSVAELYPARTQGDGRTWFKAVRGQEKPDQWAWTCDPAQAHEDSQCQRCLGHPSRCDCPEGYLALKVDQKCDDEAAAVALAREFKAARATQTLVETIKDPAATEDDVVTAAVALHEACQHGPGQTGCYLCCDDCNYDKHQCRGCGEPYVHGQHPSCADCKPEETPMPAASLSDEGVIDDTRYTEFSRYPLPPAPPRFKVIYDGWGRYKLPAPQTGRPTGFTRVTTVAKTIDDTYNLSMWSQRQVVDAVLTAVEIEQDSGTSHNIDPARIEMAKLLPDLRSALADGTQKANAILNRMADLNGGADARELGTAVHAWLEALDVGTVLLWQIPEMFQPYAVAYQEALQRAGLVAVPDYVERIVLNDFADETVAGTLDRIYRCVTTGELFLGDVKTSKAESLKYAWLSYGTQFALYASASKMMAADGSGWQPMPEIDKTMCFCVHVPSDQPERSQVVPFNLLPGGDYMMSSIEVRQHRKQAQHDVPGATYPVPSEAALRYVEARQAIQNIRDAGELAGIWEKYEEVWEDSLTELGQQAAALLTETAQEK